MGSVSKNDFNYESVDSETASKLEYYAKTGHSLIRKSQIQFIADMGKLLSEARAVLSSHKTGTFIKWATAEFDIEKNTIYRYLNAWDRILCQACNNYLHWSQGALYLASAEDFPQPVMKQLEKIPATERVRTSDVKRLIEANKPKSQPAAGADSKPDSQTAQDPEEEGDVPFGGDPPMSETPAPEKVETPQQSSSGQKSDEQWGHLRTMAIKHIEALQRTLGDLNSVRPIRFLETSLDDCREMIVNLRGMK